MKLIFAAIMLLFASLQTWIAWYWSQPEAVTRFEQLFHILYDRVPPWSAAAFSVAEGWFIAPAAIGVFLLAAILRESLRAYFGLAALAAFVVTAGMFYAMYPLHLMWTYSSL